MPQARDLGEPDPAEADRAAAGSGASAYLYGPWTWLGLAVALACAALDQAVKLWLLFGLDLPARGPIGIGPVFELVLTWNTGISYGLFQQAGPLGQWALVALKVVAVALLWAWLARAGTRLTALSLGLIIGGALGNAIDRVAYGAVLDFALFYLTVGTTTFRWYVFNLADVGIVAGVIGLLYESMFGRAAKAP